MSRPTQPPARRSGSSRIASIDVEWTDKLVKNGNRPFCYSIVWLDLPTDAPADLTAAGFEWTSVYVDDPGEQDELVATAAATLRTAAEHADLITGHQLCSDLAVLANKAPRSHPALDQARAQWKQRNQPAPGPAVRYLDTRYDAGHLLDGHSRRLVDVCTELGLDVTQPELLSTSMPAWHRKWIGERATEGRERISVLNLRHSLSTAYVAALAAGLTPRGQQVNVNKILATGAKGAWGWLEHPTFTQLLEAPCPSTALQSSASKAAKPRAKRR
ncbi:hypothetical protein [Streptomyces sp. WM6378]|uniref:hypothetical protein n=1 Tax=Streptomyces sp. WM6378 TaxID=1415557 RepID=UPI0006B0150F|nr:hypothetical protein [Streptomyces sp. WM6378]KOU50097.1 hypothetical protein ADK54_10075 [Streptomyces sp. WM6378]